MTSMLESHRCVSARPPPSSSSCSAGPTRVCAVLTALGAVFPVLGSSFDMAHRVGVIGGDGIGPEVGAGALKVVRATGVALETTDYDIGFDRAVRDGVVLPDDMLDELRSQDAILFGAVGGPPTSTALAPGLIERGIILKLRFELDQFVNLR